jgi:signal-transduction protein with cAMP-binding, CBS, and nucleotidyltransferase domain
MSNVKELLETKGRDIWSIDATESVYNAVAMMADRNVGALVVTNSVSPMVGIISERDYTRGIILANKASQDTLVSEIMSSDVIFATESTLLEKCMTLMLQKKIRHLPIVDNNEAIAMITLGDILKTIIKQQSLTIEELENFIYEDQGGEG